MQAELGYDQFHGLWHTECFPPNHNPNRSIDPVGWYSPGVCPSGYSAALVSTTTESALESQYSSDGFSISSIADETTVWCCPAGYSMPWPGIIGCSSLAENIVVTSCSDNSYTRTTTQNPSLGPVTFWTCESDKTISTSASVLPAYADPIYVKYRPSDLPVLQKVSPTWGEWANAKATVTGATSSSGAQTGSASSISSGGLSQDAKIAIGVTIPVVVISLVLGAFVVMRWHRKGPHSSLAREPGLGVEKPELDGQRVPGSTGERKELSGTQENVIIPTHIPELHGESYQPQPVEIDGLHSNLVSELDRAR